ncbi:hypothetical protein [Frigidibacter sp. MR17.24]|uniref:hypothetical protein n=1 Tax=Frigidibacter sp. MR17.24 TaxID=3127345 RepID=UPI003012A200
MSRLLILGNSHVAALKSAHGAEPGRWPGLDIAFAGAAGGALDGLRRRGGVLEATDPEAVEQLTALNGSARFALDGVDAVVITGCELSMFRAVSVLRRVIWPDCVDSPGPGQVLTSRAFVREALVTALQSTLAARLAREIGGDGAVPVIVAAQPNPCWLGEDAVQLAAFLRARRLGYATRLARIFTEAAAAALAPAAAFLPQPDETLRGPLFTRPKYSQGSLRLTRDMAKPHEGDDYLHANAAYGALVLDQLATLAGTAPRR